jgi:hypothetical protein
MFTLLGLTVFYYFPIFKIIILSLLNKMKCAYNLRTSLNIYLTLNKISIDISEG